MGKGSRAAVSAAVLLATGLTIDMAQARPGHRPCVGGRVVIFAAPFYAFPRYSHPYSPYSPYYPYAPYYYPPPVYYPPPPAPVYIEQPQAPMPQQSPSVQTPQPAAGGYFYYCPAAGAYYPQVGACPSGWQRVEPPPPPPSAPPG